MPTSHDTKPPLPDGQAFEPVPMFAGWTCWRRAVWLTRPVPLTDGERAEVKELIEGDRMREEVRDASI